LRANDTIRHIVPLQVSDEVVTSSLLELVTACAVKPITTIYTVTSNKLKPEAMAYCKYTCFASIFESKPKALQPTRASVYNTTVTFPATVA
jgi:hypothetical protein